MKATAIWLALALAAPAARAAAPPAVVVFAASSLTNVLQAAAADFERATGTRVLVNVGASNSQARQILDGAPADVFCSADESQMDVVERAGRVAAGSRVTLASNRLVVMVPADRARTLHAVDELLAPTFRRIAVGDPAAVPVGVYTREYLERLGLWAAFQPRIVPTVNVRAALAAVDSGNADAAFVYATDAPLAAHASIAFTVPAAQAPPIRYPGAVITGGANGDGGWRFLRFLQSDAGRALFTRAGFIVPERSGP